MKRENFPDKVKAKRELALDRLKDRLNRIDHPKRLERPLEPEAAMKRKLHLMKEIENICAKLGINVTKYLQQKEGVED